MDIANLDADDSSTASDSAKGRQVRKRRRVYGEKLCQVCGDKALAHHFGALACETCKAFFRRNALKQEIRKCLFEGKCPVDKKTRRFCPPCRLQKCFAVGMQSDLILDEEERKERMQKVNEKRMQQKKAEAENSSPQSGCMVTTSGHDTYSSPEDFSPVSLEGSVTVSQSSPGVPEWSPGVSAVVVKTLDCHSPVQTVSKTSYSSSDVDISGLTPTLPTTSYVKLGPTEMPVAVAVAKESQQAQLQSVEQEKVDDQHTPGSSLKPALVPFEHVPRDQLPSDPFMYWRLSDEERCLLAKLSAAYQDTVLSILKNNPPKTYLKMEEVTLEFYFQECEFEVRNCISFAKRMEDFRGLNTDEQAAVLKASTAQVLGIRSCALFVDEKCAWLSSAGYFTIEHARKMCPDHPHMELGTKFCKVVKDIVKNDFTLYALLHCVVLFDPSDEKIIDRQLINSIRDKYIILLRHYLESVYSYAHSEKYLMALQEKLVFYRNLSREGKPLIKKFFPSIPNQLLVEVMDLE